MEYWSGRVDGNDSDILRIHQVIQVKTLDELMQDEYNGKKVCFVSYNSNEGIRRNNGRLGAADGWKHLKTALSNFPIFDTSIKFYDEALGLKVVREKFAEDGSYKIVYLGDGITHFQLELTWLADRTEKYDLGDEEFHLAFEVDDYEGAFKKHTEMGCVVFVNDKMGIYFITDPDGYWIEILPPKK